MKKRKNRYLSDLFRDRKQREFNDTTWGKCGKHLYAKAMRIRERLDKQND